MRRVYWIGGGSGAGKSTIARRVAARNGLSCPPDHPGDSLFLSEFIAMDFDQRWVTRSPETMLETFHWFRGEGFALIIKDLLSMPPPGGPV